MSKNVQPGEAARREARAGFEHMAYEDAIRRRVRGAARKRAGRPGAGLLLWALLGAGLVTGIAAAAAELIG